MKKLAIIMAICGALQILGSAGVISSLQSGFAEVSNNKVAQICEQAKIGCSK